ncbi:Hypothetical predicted protein [Cloeon dipterum]|uniref:Regulator of G-protein signaling 12 n=1 Tax=Cloeon dipterum TaxID=197152 RepID=A0A8S1C3F8_9INSE|nr:Hypothetical predicted protein [Cloeon dipterum]
MAATTNENGNIVDEFEEAFQACLGVLTKDDAQKVEVDELRSEVDQVNVRFVDLARQMEAFFLQKRFLLSALKPELIVKEDMQELKVELARKDELLMRHYEKIAQWQHLLADLQSWAKSPAHGQPPPGQVPPGQQTPQPSPIIQPGIMPNQVPGMAPGPPNPVVLQQQQMQQQHLMQQQQQQQMQQGPPMSPAAGHPVQQQMMFMQGPPRGPMGFPGPGGAMQAGLQGPLAYLEKTTSNIGMPDTRRGHEIDLTLTLLSIESKCIKCEGGSGVRRKVSLRLLYFGTCVALTCIVAGSPAEIAGLQPGHALMAVNGRNVDRLPHDTVVRLIGSSCGRLRLHVSPHWHEQSSSSDSEGETAVRNPVRLSPRSAAPPAELRAVVGYLGTIELPRHLTPGSRLAVIRSCVRRMRSERRVHTVVALSVRRRHSVVLSDASGGTIAEFGAERVAFCGACADDRRFFGLVTNSERAAAFRVACTPNGVGCAEFPSHADPILRAIASLTAAASPPPPPPRSNASSCPSSNSDSGIGFRDEDSLQDRLTVRAMPDPPVEQMRKLSPKVYGNVAHSLEDLPAASPALPSGDDESMTSIDHWGSLQDLARLDQGRQRRRRKHPTHHQHPMQPPSQPPQSQSPPPTLDDESDSHKESSEAKGALGAHGRNHSDVGEVDPSKPNCFDSFEKLLDDPNGMHAFSEFLKKEFSHENIYFWVACEKYRRLKDQAARKALAKNIFQKHLCSGAPEPVNVDSQARQATKDGLEEAKENLFVATQKQIFNLMKFDSYPRFLKSDSYKDSSEHFNLDPDLILHAKDEPNPGKLKKSQSDAEDRRRKSLLPWGRKNSGQSRSKSRDRGEEKGHDDSSSIRSELTSSRSSLASSDLALIQRNTSSRQSVSLGDVSQSGELCRVILPDGATTVISTVRGDTVKQLIARLLEKRGLQYSTFEIYASGQSNSVNLSDESSVLSGKEVRVEQRVVFRLDLPSKKTLGVRAKASKTLAEVLKPILNKHNLKLENAIVTLICDTTPLDVNKPITSVENERLQVCISGNSAGQAKGNKSTLDEITNRVFEELLQGKPTESAQGSDQGSVKSEDWSSDHGSGIFGRFLRRDSAFTDKTRESKSKKGAVPRFIDVHDNTLRVPGLRVNPKGQSESEELYEGLKRAQRGRLEDQRGTDINFELPDFLKDKENSPRWLQKGRLSEGDCLPLMSTEGIDLSSGLVPTVEQAEAYFGSRMPPLSPPIRHPMDPPPLPPKPKTYPKHASNVRLELKSVVHETSIQAKAKHYAHVWLLKDIILIMSDEDEYQVKKAFPVDGLLKTKVTLKPGEAPSDAIEYLRFVAHEASQCEDVVVAVIDEKKLRKQTVVYSSGFEKKDENPLSLQLVPREWKICQVSDFSNVRTQLAKMKASSSKTAINVQRKELPPKGDQRSWCRFCLGSEICAKIYETTALMLTDSEEFHPPLASIIFSLDQKSYWSTIQGLELPLTPDVCSVIRALARTCANVRDKLQVDSDAQLVTALNLIICLVSKYFRQLDLEDL